MNLTYTVPELAYSAKYIAEFITLSRSLQGDSYTDMGSAIFAVYPEIREEETRLLHQTDLENYCIDRLRFNYDLNRPKFAEKTAAYQHIWNKYRFMLAQALGDIFQMKVANQYNGMTARVTLCPICPRFLEDHSFDIFYQYSAEGSLYIAMHEITHFLWFDAWNKLFHDSPALYEQPHLPWIFSELAIDAILSDTRLNSLIFNEHQAKHPAYPEFYKIHTGDGLLVDLFRNMYNRLSMNDFMQEGYHFLKANSALFAPYFG